MTESQAEHKQRTAAVIILVSLMTVAAGLPVYLVGALSLELGEELAFGAAGIGIAVAVFRGSSAVFAIPFGKVADRFGSVTSLRGAALLATVGSAGVAFGARSFVTLLAWLIVGGCAFAMAAPAGNRLVARAVPANRRGVAFGVKQASMPVSASLAGMSLPFVALTLGWRWAFGIAAVIALFVAAMVGPSVRVRGDSTRNVDKGSDETGQAPTWRQVRGFAFAFMAGNFANSVAPVFYVAAAVRAGTSPGTAGTVLAAASAGAIAIRVVSGIACDRIVRGHLVLCASLLAAGAVGFVLLATGEPNVMAVGLAVAMGGAWGFHSVFWFAAVDRFPQRVATVTGMLTPAGHFGHLAGPLAFGVIAQTLSFPFAWTVSAIAAGLAAIIMFVSR